MRLYARHKGKAAPARSGAGHERKHGVLPCFFYIRKKEPPHQGAASICYVSAIIFQLIPNGSVTRPNIAPQNTRSNGISTSPPLDKPSNALRASSSDANSKAKSIFPYCTGPTESAIKEGEFSMIRALSVLSAYICFSEAHYDSYEVGRIV